MAYYTMYICFRLRSNANRIKSTNDSALVLDNSLLSHEMKVLRALIKIHRVLNLNGTIIRSGDRREAIKFMGLGLRSNFTIHINEKDLP